jgi:hypothetical protein
MLDIRADEGVALPHLVGVGLGEGLARLAGGLLVGLEQLELVDQAAKSIGSDPGAGEYAFFDADAVEQR